MDRPVMPFHVALPRQSCEVLDKVALECLGKTLVDLAEEDPTGTYMFLRGTILGMFSQNDDTDTTFIFQDGSSITSDQDGEAAKLAVTNSMNRALESIIVQPIDVMLSAFRTQEDEGGPVLHFTVEPADLAS